MLKNETVQIQGELGHLETIVLPPIGKESCGVAVINHPNPTQGGSNMNKVVHTAAKALRKKGYTCYLPNLRGVGNSAGEHDYGRGEVNDVLAVIEYAQLQHGMDSYLILAGFSFGGYVACKVAQLVKVDQLLLIAAAVTKYPELAPAVPEVDNTLFIHGALDEVVPLPEVLAWCAPQQLPIVLVPDAEHFFHGKLILLEKVISRFLTQIMH